MSMTVKTAVVHGISWLYRIEQPNGALVDHHGIAVHLDDEKRMMWFVPRGANDRPLIVLATKPPINGDALKSVPLGPGELDALATWCETIRVPVIRAWNGDLDIGSIALALPAHPSLLRARQAYTDGCPDHPTESVFCRCGWQRAGRAKLRLPRMFDRSESTV